MTEALFDVVTVHCFWTLAGCPHTVTACDPDTAHDEMEWHYATVHSEIIRALVGG